MTERRYSREEVDAILGRAVERERKTDDLSREQLVAIAQEVGVTPESIDRAIEEIAAEHQGEEELVRLRRRAWRGFVGHLVPYLCVNFMLVVINGLTTRFPWALFPIVGWGIGLLLHLFAVAVPSPEQLERRLQYEREREDHRQLRREERDRRRQLKRRVEAGAKELEGAVGKGVAALLQAAADRVSQGVAPAPREAPRRIRIDENDPRTRPPTEAPLAEPREPTDATTLRNDRNEG
jgi:hypothetical protein